MDGSLNKLLHGSLTQSPVNVDDEKAKINSQQAAGSRKGIIYKRASVIPWRAASAAAAVRLAS